ncbi:transmembrane protein 82 isoform X2 [Chanos chanos]|uniref:Transmembrane protein 82 isoform X2 n=1 Tax=Chanos chanos TaxID=29144 RepID=A0A6J2V220_CHACN|nr:transmembrane protein 82 isoform X2 [Chanos chanos]
MLPSVSWFTSRLSGWLTLEANPVECLLQGLVGACGISIFCNLVRIHLFLESQSSNDDKGAGKSKNRNSQRSRLTKTLQFWFLTGILSVVGSRVASLVILEFSLRAVSARMTSGSVPHNRSLLQLLIQCQFSLGCALSGTLYFLHEGAPQRWLNILLAAGLSWFLASLCSRLEHHVMSMYPLHSTERYCGVCIGLLTSGTTILPFICCALIMTFTVAGIAAISSINQHFLSATEALRFWTPLTICYTLLIVYMQEQSRQPDGQAILNAVVVRLGGLLVLMLTVGRWADVIHILVCFLGEAGCLIPAQDLLDAIPQTTEGLQRSSTQRNENQRSHVKFKNH